MESDAYFSSWKNWWKTCCLRCFMNKYLSTPLFFICYCSPFWQEQSMCYFQWHNFQICFMCYAWFAAYGLPSQFGGFCFLCSFSQQELQMLGKWQHIPAVIADFPGMPGFLLIPMPHRIRGCTVPVGHRAPVGCFSQVLCQDFFFFLFQVLAKW